jgi:hypothetical protein
MARAHTVAINAASQAAPIIDIPAEYIEMATDERGAPLRAIPGIVQAMAGSLSDGRMLHESGRVPWSSPASEMNAAGYCHFPGPAPSQDLQAQRSERSQRENEALPL